MGSDEACSASANDADSCRTWLRHVTEGFIERSGLWGTIRGRGATYLRHRRRQGPIRRKRFDQALSSCGEDNRSPKPKASTVLQKPVRVLGRHCQGLVDTHEIRLAFRRYRVGRDATEPLALSQKSIFQWFDFTAAHPGASCTHGYITFAGTDDQCQTIFSVLQDASQFACHENFEEGPRAASS